MKIKNDENVLEEAILYRYQSKALESSKKLMHYNKVLTEIENLIL